MIVLVIFIVIGEGTLTLNSPPLPATAASQSSRQHIRNKMRSHLMRQHEKGIEFAFINWFKAKLFVQSGI